MGQKELHTYEEVFNTTLSLLGRVHELNPYNDNNIYYLLNLCSNPAINLNDLGEGIYADQIIDVIYLLMRQKILMGGITSVIKENNIENLEKLNVFLADYIYHIGYANNLVIKLNNLGYSEYMLKKPIIQRPIFTETDPEIGIKLDVVLK